MIKAGGTIRMTSRLDRNIKDDAVKLDEVWRNCWQGIGASGSEAEVFRDLVERYGEPHRAYHTIEHVEECLDVFAWLRAEAVDPPEVEIAIWFHDAIYRTERKDNEERSAELAAAVLSRAEVPAQRIEAVRELILVTRHDAAPRTPDQAVLLDCDLAILGASPDRFAAYDAQIRREYRWVPGFLYSRERQKVLRSFLARPRIYRTKRLFEEREKQARENLERMLRDR
jgi:predicted metal-dependent HD superfamily phosphohydrolase